STLHLHIPEDYLQKLHSTRQPDTYPLLRLDFSGLTVDAPLLSQITKQFNVENNIISAQMDYAGGVKFGIMLTEMIGDENDINNAINFLIKNNTQVEVIGYV
ncbi:MAG: DL-methionine transporter ATP-binding subunit, partial [Candidatus Schmidhempelia sp.]|nr:DL-methionine transporter ATP-binding subunit [Candidatus Schmidhempelia sp.]